jgi:hypothetical protein
MLGLPLLATAFWLVVRQPLLAMSILVFSDLLGLGPSIRKAWLAPQDESASQWAVNALRHTVSLFAIGSFTAITALNPTSCALADAAFVVLLLARRCRGSA